MSQRKYTNDALAGAYLAAATLGVDDNEFDRCVEIRKAIASSSQNIQETYDVTGEINLAFATEQDIELLERILINGPEAVMAERASGTQTESRVRGTAPTSRITEQTFGLPAKPTPTDE